jgi:hypothetical protein
MGSGGGHAHQIGNTANTANSRTPLVRGVCDGNGGVQAFFENTGYKNVH